MPLYFITGNAGKFSEVKAFIPSVEQIDIDLDEIQELDPHKVIQHKLLQATKTQTGELIIEDTSLYIEGLHGMPGPFIKWFLKSMGPAGLAELVKKTHSIKATAKTIIGYVKDQGEPQYFEGSVEGNIVEPKGDLGFGWDGIFQPQGSIKTFGEMTREEKADFSMRKKAVLKLQAFLFQ